MSRKGSNLGAMRAFVSLSGFYFSTKVLGRRMPLLANVKLTYQCNLKCAGCPFHLRSREENSHMSWETAIECLDRLKDMGCRIVIFEGGEPLLWKDAGRDFSDLAGYARRHFICVGATTNGTLSLDVPTDILWVSIDGLENTHNALRSNSYGKVLENIRSSMHNRLMIHYTLNNKNWSDFEELVKIVTDIRQIKGITLQLFYPYNQGEEELALTNSQRKDALIKAIELKRRGYPVMNSFKGLRAMIHNTWTCHDWLLANVDPDGELSVGCYVTGRGEKKCSQCGFTPVAEASLAYDLVPGALYTGWRLFASNR